MGFSIATALGAAIDQYAVSAKNLESIREARRKRQMEDEKFKLDKQEQEAKIGKMRLEGVQTEQQTKIQEAYLNEYLKQQKTIASGKDALLDQTEQEEATKLKQSANVVNNIMPHIVRAGYVPVPDATGKITLKQVKQDKWAGYTGTSRRPYDELAVNNHAEKLTNIELRKKGVDPKTLALENPEEYGRLIESNVPRAEKTMYGKVLSEVNQQPQQQNNIGNINQQSTIQEGTRAVNKKTGERMEFKGGKWQKI